MLHKSYGLPFLACLYSLAGASFTEAAPATLYWEGDHLASVRQAAVENRMSTEVRQALAGLQDEAEEALTRGPYSVVDKKVTPPSGDKRDYLSYSRYWWPNPDTPDGLPYIRKDGVVNRRLLAKGDRNRIGALFDDVKSLALAAYLIDAERYAPHAVLLLRTWFVEPATRMNPNLNFGQGVPGRAAGRGVGVIDTRHFIRVLDAVAVLDELGQLTESDNAALKAWFDEYLTWLQTSELGLEERAAENNHGTWYVAQAARIALYVGQRDFAKRLVEEVRDSRIDSSFSADGSQPAELERTRSLHYSLFNLEALTVVARMGEQVGVNLWRHKTKSGKSMAQAIEFVAPYVESPTDWPYPEMSRFHLSDSQSPVFLLGGARLSSQRLANAAEQTPRRQRGSRLTPLLFPTYGAEDKESSKLTIAEVPTSQLKPAQYTLPDLSRFTAARVRSRVPRERVGKVSLRLAEDIPLMKEAFRGDRGKDLHHRQGGQAPQVILVAGGAIGLDQVVAQLADEKIAQREGDIVTLRRPLAVQSGAALVIDGKQTPVLRLSTDKGAFLANAGELYIVDAQVTAWSEHAGEPTHFKNKKEFRPFISSYIRSQTYVAQSKIEHLGYAASTAYGFSLSSHPERERDESESDWAKENWPTGLLVDNEFRGLYYGFYSFEACDVAIVRNQYVDNIVYGIDPHDRSTRLIIAGNTAKGTKQKHGIIGSRGVSHSAILDNVCHDNAGSGFMLDRQCRHNLIVGNKAYRNDQGMGIYESPENIIADNLVAFNKACGLRVRNSTDIEITGNNLVGNGDYALLAYSSRLDDHAKRYKKGDVYQQQVAVSFFDNVVAENRGVMKATGLGLLRIGKLSRQANLGPVDNGLGLTGTSPQPVEEHRFGGALRRYSTQLERAIDRGLALEIHSR